MDVLENVRLNTVLFCDCHPRAVCVCVVCVCVCVHYTYIYIERETEGEGYINTYTIHILCVHIMQL